MAAGLYALANAQLVSGIGHFLRLTRFEEVLNNGDLVITGEGSIDLQTLQGKSPYGVAKLAKQKHKFVVAMAGQLPLQIPPGLKQYFDLLLPINEGPFDLASALKNTAMNLEKTAYELGQKLKLNQLKICLINSDIHQFAKCFQGTYRGHMT